MPTILTNPNDRIYYAAQGVLYKEYQTTTSGGDEAPTSYNWLSGVQAVGISSDTPNNSGYVDGGRFQRKYISYGKTGFEITISRVIPSDGSFFYNVDAVGTKNYETTHILADGNIGYDGFSNNLRSYDITLVYGSDSFDYIGQGNDLGGAQTDENTIMATTYRRCLLTAVSYSLNVDGSFTEDLSFSGFIATQDTNTTLSDYTNLNAALPESKTTLKRQFLDVANTVFPEEIVNQFNLGNSKDGQTILGLQTIDISCTIEYSDLLDIGRWNGGDLGAAGTTTANRAQVNKFRQVSGTEVTCEFTGITRAQYHAQPNYFNFENVDNLWTAGATDGIGTASNFYTHDKEINIVIKDSPAASNYFHIMLGKSNCFQGFSTSGGDAGDSGPATTTGSYVNYHNDFVTFKDSSATALFTPTTTY